MQLREVSNFDPRNQAGAKCTFCGQHARMMERGQRRARTFSTGVHIHMEGVIEVCEICLTQGGLAVGMIDPDIAAAQEAQIDALANEVEELNGSLVDKSDAITLLATELAEAEDRGATREKRGYEKGYADAATAHDIALNPGEPANADA